MERTNGWCVAFGGGQALRRFRLCPQCVTEKGIMTFAIHDGACKQWPGSAREHEHQFCFKCTGQWGAECRHDRDCADPGIQQVRRVATAVPIAGGGQRMVERLEIGHVDSAAYIACLQCGAGVGGGARLADGAGENDGRGRRNPSFFQNLLRRGSTQGDDDDDDARAAAAAGGGGGGGGAEGGGDHDFPPTVFPDGSRVSGAQRQRALGMLDKAAMLAEMRRGTT